jgi:DNA-directed RNA polymerase specialized sigma24 family protein
MSKPCISRRVDDYLEIRVREMTGWSDERIVKACLEGNEEAWSALIDKYKNLIYSIPIKYGLSRDDAGEIFQQVCLRLLAELPSLRDPNCVGAWLIRVTSHDCFHWTRRERFQESRELDSMNAAQAARTPAPDEYVGQAEREQILREALQNPPFLMTRWPGISNSPEGR